MNQPSKNVSLTFGAPRAIAERADAIAAKLSRGAVSIPRSAVLRSAIAMGMDALEASVEASGDPTKGPFRIGVGLLGVTPLGAPADGGEGVGVAGAEGQSGEAA